MTTIALVSNQPFSPGLTAVLQDAGSVSLALQAAEARVRQQPAALDARWPLFQWLCLVGDWPRALKQLQMATQLAPDFAQTAHVYRDLIRAEIFRAAVLNGEREPGALLVSPAWVLPLLDALKLARENNLDNADRCREQALSEGAAPAGTHDGTPFGWITDSDTRYGPTCELISAGRYAWLPFTQMRKLEMQPVTGLLDLIWRPATVTLIDGAVCRGFTPARYSRSEHSGEALQLARETHWTDVGQTGVIALGQKTWMTDAGDVGLLDVISLTFEHGA
jgi:type VI secretion system protein ImpE